MGKSKYDPYKDQILQLLKQNDFKHNKVSRIMAPKLGLKGDGGNGLRSYCKKVADELRLSLLEVSVKNDTSPNDYTQDKMVLSAWDHENKRLLTVEEYCEKFNLPYDCVRSYKFLPYHYKEPAYHLVFNEIILERDDFTKEFIESVIKEFISPVKTSVSSKEKSDYFDRLIVSDVHVGMEPDPDGFSLYGGVWNEQELLQRASLTVDHVLSFKKGSELYIDDLGDLLDGWDGKTVRKGHDLPQNMTNSLAFQAALKFKMRLVDSFVSHYNHITINNVCEDNHSGEFGFLVNFTLKEICRLKYPERVSVINRRRFIEHYFVGSHAFVICHGKDSKNLKFGFKPVLNPKQIEKIDLYLKEHKIFKQAEYIEFSKGDSHQFLLDYTTAQDFDYFNYPSFAPPSDWVQTNFKKGKSGVVLQNVKYDGPTKIINPLFFEFTQRAAS